MPSLNNVQKEFLESLQGHNSLPYLFVGSGLSRRYFGLPDWAGLLNEFATRAGVNSARISSKVGGDYPRVATEIANEFFDIWWDSPDYEEQRIANPEPVDANHILKIAVSDYLQKLENEYQLDPTLSAERDTLKKCVLNGVITTNYDSMVEKAFPEFDPYIGQDELLLGDAQFIGEIYKIHGSVEKPASLVLTAEDYERVETKNQYLAAKLLTIFAEHPVIFVGYSLNDKYIRQILADIVTAVGPERLGELGSRIYFVQWNPDPTFETRMAVTQSENAGEILPITEIKTHSFQWIWEALSQLERTFPAKALRALKKQIYKLVINPDPEDTVEPVKAVPIDSDEAEGLKIVFGVTDISDYQLAVLNGFGTQTLSLEDVYRDILEMGDREVPADFALRTGITDQVKAQPNWYVPVWKYLTEAERVSANGYVDFDSLPETIKRLAYRDAPTFPASSHERYRETFGMDPSPSQILQSEDSDHFKMNSLRHYLDETQDGESVREALKGWMNAAGADEWKVTDTRKVIFLLDRVLYKPKQS